MAAIKKVENYKWGENVEESDACDGWWECKMGQPLQKRVWRFLKKKLKIGAPGWLSRSSVQLLISSQIMILGS